MKGKEVVENNDRPHPEGIKHKEEEIKIKKIGNFDNSNWYRIYYSMFILRNYKQFMTKLWMMNNNVKNYWILVKT